MSKVNSCSSMDESPSPFEYSRAFFLLSKKGDIKVPDPITQCEMEESGLGTKYLSGSIYESKFDVMTKLEKLYPDLLRTGGVRWMRRSAFGLELYPITADDNEISGMSGRTLMNSGDYTIYLSPVQQTVKYHVEKIQGNYCFRCKYFFEFSDLIVHCNKIPVCEVVDFPDLPGIPDY